MTIRPRVMIVDDEDDVRAALRQLLEVEGIDVVDCAEGHAALGQMKAGFEGVVVTDLRMPGIDGSALFHAIAERDPEVPVVIISGHGDLATAVALVREGAYDFLSKPFDPDRLLATVRNALDARALVLENRALRAARPELGTGDLLGESRVIENVRTTLGQLAQADIDVLITGESGTGKTLAASLIHRRSLRARKSMTVVDCGALPGEHAESLMFGHAGGAVAGMSFPRTGQLLLANAGILMLDHVDGLPRALQARLQQALDDGSITPIGGQPQTTRFRTLATSSADLAAAVQRGDFLPSLYYRLGDYRLELPPLRARGDDVVVLFRSFLAEAVRAVQVVEREPPVLTPAIWRRLHDHDWPGNVRELRSFAVNVALGLGVEAPAPDAPGSALRHAVAQFEAGLLRAALERNRGDVVMTAAALELPRKTFYDKLARHAIDPADYRRKN